MTASGETGDTQPAAQLPPGTHRVRLTIADVSERLDRNHLRVAYLSVVVRDEPAVGIETLVPVGKPAPEPGHVYGVAVDCATVGVADAVAARHISDLPYEQTCSWFDDVVFAERTYSTPESYVTPSTSRWLQPPLVRTTCCVHRDGATDITPCSSPAPRTACSAPFISTSKWSTTAPRITTPTKQRFSSVQGVAAEHVADAPGAAQVRCTSALLVQPSLRKCSQTREPTNSNSRNMLSHNIIRTPVVASQLSCPLANPRTATTTAFSRNVHTQASHYCVHCFEDPISFSPISSSVDSTTAVENSSSPTQPRPSR